MIEECKCGKDSNHDSGFCPGARPEDDPCSICGGKLDSDEAVRLGECSRCLASHA